MIVQTLAKKAAKWASLNRERLLLFLGMVLVGGLCFEAGLLYGALREGQAVSISVVAPSQAAETVSEAPVARVAGQAIVSGAAAANCAFVGSRNSDKYHLPKCSSAKRIKPENLVCFASEEDAKKKGYVPGCLK